MKKLVKLNFILAVVLVISSIAVYASPGYDPGVKGDATTKKGEYKYQEVVFLTGGPIMMSGTVLVSEDAKGTKSTLTYKLANTAKNAKLDRKVVFLNTTSSNSLGSQTAYSTTIDPKYSEVIQIGSDKFTLAEYQFSRSALTDDRKIIKYQTANWNGRKVYNRNSNAGQVAVDIDSEQYRYDNYWSTTETSIIKNTLTYTCLTGSSTATYKDVMGTVEYAVSNSSMKNLEYVKNALQDISFTGGYVMKESQENVVSYNYDVPVISGWVASTSRNVGKNSYKLTTVPTQTRLFATNIKDVADNYWAAEDIKKATSMDIINVQQNNYFRPLSYISRAEFAKAIVKATNMTVDPADKTKLKTYDALFDDVDKTHPLYQYINSAVNAGIINGTDARHFSPDEYLTKAQAVAIIVRAMGLEDNPDMSSTQTPFADDYKVQPWAKKSINVAHYMGLITSNQDNEIEPDRFLTRAECAAMINRFINYLQYDIKKEYREKIINFGR